MTKKLVSVVTVVYNAAHEIEKTLESISRQKNELMEYIVLDGGSTDGTLEILQKYKASIDYLQSKKDGGIYEAMNESLKYVSGIYVININAGDILYEIPYTLLKEHSRTSAITAICGVVEVEKDTYVQPECTRNIRLHNTIPHQGCFYKTEIFKNETYNTSYRVFADFDLNQRLYKAGKKIITSSCIIAFHSLRGVSNDKRYACELFKIVRQNFGLINMALSWFYFKRQGLKERWKKLNRKTTSSDR